MKYTEKIKDKYWMIILFSIFIFSFLLDLCVLTRYSLSYGIDGPFYNLQIQNILTTGFPASGDPPFAYYILTPFVMLTGNSFLGLKIGISLIGSLMAFPAFLLTECHVKHVKIGSKAPALLSAFLITINANYFTMIGGYGVLQNLIGVFFLTLLLYFLVKWLENIGKWRKYGVLTIILLGCNVLTHIYTGALAVILLFSVLLFTVILKIHKTGKLPVFDLKVLGAFSVLTIGCILSLFTAYPVMYSKFITVLSFFGLSSGITSTNGGDTGGIISNTFFLSLPYLTGIFASIMILKQSLKEKLGMKGRVNKNILLAWLYLTLAGILAVMAFLPSQYQYRFVLMAFLPIALIVPLGLKYIETEVTSRKLAKRKNVYALTSVIAVIFALSSLYTAAAVFPTLGSTITDDQYKELVIIKQNYMPNTIDDNATVVINDFSTLYWVEYALNIPIATNNQSVMGKNGNNNMYAITFAAANSSQFNMPGYSPVSGSFFLPYGPSILPNTLDKTPFSNQQSQSAMNNPVGPDINRTQIISGSGTLIYNGDYVKIYKIR